MNCRLVFLAGGAALFATAASAQQQQPGPVTRSTVAAQLDSAFAAADTNHDGSLSPSEIEATSNRDVENARSAARTKLQAQFKQLDTNKDGQLSWAEFSAILAALKAPQTPAQILQRLDTNHDGKLSAGEFKAPRLGLFDKVDLNHDGTVTPDEERRANGQK
jgi:Ca2+-binding EF-hand superfamily protein